MMMMMMEKEQTNVSYSNFDKSLDDDDDDDDDGDDDDDDDDVDDRAVCFEQVHLRVFAHRQLDAPDTSEQCKQRQETDHCRVARCQFEI